MKRVFVTGITGLLGSNIIIKLLQDDYYVIALVRQKSSYLGKEDKNLKIIEGDLFSDITIHLQNVDFVLHIAAETRQDMLSYHHYTDINLKATIKLYNQSVQANVEKFLFVSTANTLGYGNLNNLGNESKAQKYPFTQSFYAKSKFEAEQYLMKSSAITKVIILNPTFMIGAYDYKPSSGKILYWVWKKKIAFYPKGGKSFVHVEDVANAIIKAIKNGKNKQKYILTNENLTYKEFFSKVKKLTNQKTILLPIPTFVLKVLGCVGEVLRFFKIKTNLSKINMEILGVDNFYSNKKSVDELEIKYQSIDNAIKDAIQFFSNPQKI